MSTDQAGTADAATAAFRSMNSAGFAGLLEHLRITLLVTTYQAGKLMAIRGRGGRVSTLLRGFERPMGMAVRGVREFALGTRHQVWHFRNAPDIGLQIAPVGTHDACYLPRTSHVTGDIRCHEMAWVGDELWIVNTFFSCLCSPSSAHSFVPRWSPPFVPKPTPGDHCHLNGLAVKDGKAAFVSALGTATEPEGWRSSKANGGVIVDVASGAIISAGLSMPHSPRWHAGRLWVLESGMGQLQTVAIENGARSTVAQLPGYVRGLAFSGVFAFVGLSKIRESNIFGDLPISKQVPDLQCGIWVIDLRTGRTVEFMRFEAGVDEIFAVEVLDGVVNPEIVGFQDETVNGAFVLPPG